MSDFEQFIHRVKEGIDLSGYIGSKVTLRSVGLNKYKGCCPFHNEKTPSFTVNDDLKYYHCFGCGVHGDIISFMQEKEGYDFKTALEILAEKAGIQLPAFKKDEEKSDMKQRLLDLHKLAVIFYENNLKDANQAIKYLHKRGFDNDLIAKFSLGYAPGQNSMLKFLQSKQFTDQEILASGLVRKSSEGRKYDLLQDRIIFPIFNHRNQVIGFGGRVIGDSLPKYINSPETVLFKKKQVLFNINKARSIAYEKKQIIVCEGYADVIKLAKYGFDHAVAPLGTACGALHLQQLWKVVKNPHICMDGDKAGLKSIYRLSLEALPIIKPGYSLSIVLLPEGRDPDDVVSAINGVEEFSGMLSNSMDLPEFIFHYNAELVTNPTPTNIAAFEAEIYKLCEKITDSYVKKHFLSFFKKKFYEYGRWSSKQKAITNNHVIIPQIAHSKHSEIYKLERDILIFILQNHSLFQSEKFQQELFDLDLLEVALASLSSLLQDEIESLASMSRDDYIEWLRKIARKFTSLDINFVELVILPSDLDQEVVYSNWQKMLKLYFLANIRKEYETLVVSDNTSEVERATILLEQILHLQNEINNH
ncbi:MAG: DNA primase [Rickettsiales bacterium]|jgi:DNA primase|nr:DNA primase [Rickettsiales bacterium]